MKVLIVDDNKNNRMILNLLLEEYASEHDGVDFEVTEAEDGLLALEYVNKNSFDLIFMDIMMPHLDGIATTSAIRRIDKKVMIVAVSAVDDDERKKIILNNGAEDYISKPVNADIFDVRLHSYLTLIKSRHGHQKISSKPFNLFSEDVYSYDVHFNGSNEDDLSSFWEYYLLNNTPYDGISDMVRFIFDMGLAAIETTDRVDIYEENSDEYLYLTLISPAALDPDLIMHYADKNDFLENYKLEAKNLSTKLKKVKVVNFIEPVKNMPKEEIKSDIVVEKTAPVAKISEEKVVFDFLDSNDFEDLKEYISKLNSLLLILGSSTLEDYEIDEIVMTLLQISKTVSPYSELYNLSRSFGSLGESIHAHKENFIAKSMELGPLAVAFGGDLSHWFKSLFLEGATSVGFLDDSIMSNAMMIESFINPDQSHDDADADVDDIFDF